MERKSFLWKFCILSMFLTAVSMWIEYILQNNLDNCLNSYWYHYIIKYKYSSFSVLKNHDITEDLKSY